MSHRVAKGAEFAADSVRVMETSLIVFLSTQVQGSRKLVDNSIAPVIKRNSWVRIAQLRYSESRSRI